MALKENIKKFRKESRLTQKELACKSGISFSMVSKLESGEQTNPSYQTIKKVAAALDINPDSLLKENIMKAETSVTNLTDLNFRAKLQAINTIPIPNHKLPDNQEENLFQSVELKRLYATLKYASKEEIEKVIEIVEAFRRY